MLCSFEIEFELNSHFYCCASPVQCNLFLRFPEERDLFCQLRFERRKRGSNCRTSGKFCSNSKQGLGIWRSDVRKNGEQVLTRTRLTNLNCAINSRAHTNITNTADKWHHMQSRHRFKNDFKITDSSLRLFVFRCMITVAKPQLIGSDFFHWTWVSCSVLPSSVCCLQNKVPRTCARLTETRLWLHEHQPTTRNHNDPWNTFNYFEFFCFNRELFHELLSECGCATIHNIALRPVTLACQHIALQQLNVFAL